LENKKKNQKNKDESEMRTISVKLNFLAKEEQQLNETVERLEIEKNLHVK
jgi:tousled-like kinase